MIILSVALLGAAVGFGIVSMRRTLQEHAHLRVPWLLQPPIWSWRASLFRGASAGCAILGALLLEPYLGWWFLAVFVLVFLLPLGMLAGHNRRLASKHQVIERGGHA